MIIKCACFELKLLSHISVLQLLADFPYLPFFPIFSFVTLSCWNYLKTWVSKKNRGGGGTPSLRVSRYAPRFCPHFRHLDDLFAPPNLTMSTILFRSCWVPFRSPTFSACRSSFCPPNWPNLSFYSDLLGPVLNFEWRPPTDFDPECPPPPPPPPRPALYHQVCETLQCIVYSDLFH